MTKDEAEKTRLNGGIVITPSGQAGPIVGMDRSFVSVDTPSGVLRGIPISGISPRTPIVKE